MSTSRLFRLFAEAPRTRTARPGMGFRRLVGTGMSARPVRYSAVAEPRAVASAAGGPATTTWPPPPPAPGPRSITCSAAPMMGGERSTNTDAVPRARGQREPGEGALGAVEGDAVLDPADAPSPGEVERLGLDARAAARRAPRAGPEAREEDAHVHAGGAALEPGEPGAHHRVVAAPVAL